MKLKIAEFNKKIDFIWFCVLIIAFLYTLRVDYVFFQADEPGKLFWGKYFSENPSEIFSFRSINVFPYYRLINRILWASNYFLFKNNPIPIQLLKKIVFILVILSIYHISKIICGRKAGVFAAMLFLTTVPTLQLLYTIGLTNVAFELLFLNFGVIFLFRSIFDRYKFVQNFILTAVFIILAMFSREISAIIFLTMIFTLWLFSKQTGAERKRILINSIFGLLLVGYLFYIF